MNTKWVKKEMATGFQRLITLSLVGTPPAETITVTLDAWIDALKDHFNHQETDAARIQQAFKSMILNIDRWPTPRVFLTHLPAHKPLLAITQHFTPEQIVSNRQKIALAIAQGISHKMPAKILDAKNLKYGQTKAAQLNQVIKSNQKKDNKI